MWNTTTVNAWCNNEKFQYNHDDPEVEEPRAEDLEDIDTMSWVTYEDDVLLLTDKLFPELDEIDNGKVYIILKFSCPDCYFVTYDEEKMAKHTMIKGHRKPDVLNVYVCTENNCFFKCMEAKLLVEHQKVHEKIDADDFFVEDLK